ncbi:hypothetical protein P167DRAFT_561223 [Morchella conica CCBAS932]|uniref:Uncharacterized protein n=1 Tax=Morchella conica CCBAS932 TaxID=1392247 RepID=A0A3N4L3Y9_9PEZI|nr:hypothetical protein P167DRAFT_561223 [Morchella conica CCBAS932]
MHSGFFFLFFLSFLSFFFFLWCVFQLSSVIRLASGEKTMVHAGKFTKKRYHPPPYSVVVSYDVTGMTRKVAQCADKLHILRSAVSKQGTRGPPDGVWLGDTC